MNVGGLPVWDDVVALVQLCGFLVLGSLFGGDVLCCASLIGDRSHSMIGDVDDGGVRRRSVIHGRMARRVVGSEDILPACSLVC